jgi:hypothetical protein
MRAAKTSAIKARGAASRTQPLAPRAAGRSGRSAPVAANRAVPATDAENDPELQLVDPNRLSDEEFKEFARQSHKVNLAIGATRNALLGAISAKFAAELPAINEATRRLKGDLRQLRDSVEIIRAVASTLGIIENVVKLLA